MKAISLWQPWASAIALGAKRIETRAWSTDYRGPLAIHAARTTTGLDIALQPTPRQTSAERLETWISVLGLPPKKSLRQVLLELPRGFIVATCQLTHVLPAEDVDGFAGHLLDPRRTKHGVVLEEDLGDFTPGRFAWVLESIEPRSEPLPCRGERRLFDVDLGGP